MEVNTYKFSLSTTEIAALRKPEEMFSYIVRGSQVTEQEIRLEVNRKHIICSLDTLVLLAIMQLAAHCLT